MEGATRAIAETQKTGVPASDIKHSKLDEEEQKDDSRKSRFR